MDIAHKHDNVCGLNGDLRLCLHFFKNHIVRLGFNTARVDQDDGFSVPFGFIIDAVTRNAGNIFYDGDTSACDLIEKRTFSDIRSAYDRRNCFCHGNILLYGLFLNTCQFIKEFVAVRNTGADFHTERLGKLVDMHTAKEEILLIAKHIR